MLMAMLLCLRCNADHKTSVLQVFDALRHDFNTRRRERCVRLDFPAQQGQGSVGGLEELEQLIKASIKASFETRAAAYEEEVSTWANKKIQVAPDPHHMAKES